MKPVFLTRVCFLLLACVSAAFANPGVLQFSQPVTTVSEVDAITVGADRYLTPPMTVTRTGGSTGALTVSYCVWPSEVADNAVESDNYLVADNTRRWVAAGTLTWADGDTAPKTLPFNYTAFSTLRYNLRPSSLVQGTITYSARLANVIGGATLGANATARLEILDAEAPAAGVLNFSARRFYGPEGGSAVITVRRDGGSTGAVSVNYATSSTLPTVGGNQQLIGAGVSGTHYIAASGTLSWADGDTAAKTFTVTLPATSSANGPLNVALNLSAPGGGAVLGTAPSALLTIQNTASTVFDINDNIDGSTFRVSLPPGPGPVRGVLFWWPGSGGDDRHFTTDPNFRKIADLWRFAIASPRGNYDAKPNRFEFPHVTLGFLADRLSQIALNTGRPEIAHAPFVLSGMSAGSYSTSRSLNVWPERIIAALGQEGWEYPPLPLTANTLSPLTKEIPALNLGGQLDATQSPPSTIIPAFNEFRKAGLTRAAVMMCWGRGHTFSNTGAAYNSVALHWLDQVMAAGRYPSNLAPTATTAPALGSLALSSGWWGARNSTNTSSYELSGGSSRFLAIGPDASYSGVKDVNNALVDSWLPTEAAARAYRAFVSLPSITFSTPAQFTSGLVGNPVTLSIAENGFGSGLTKIEFFDGATKIGEDTTSPYGLTWTPTAVGARGLTAVASTASGPAYSAFTLFLAAAPTAPTITPGQSYAGVVNLPFSYQLAAGGPPTSYALASGTLPPGVTLNPATGLLSGTPTTAGTYTPAFTATNSVGTSAAVSVSLTISATAGLIVHEAFAYTVGANNPDPDAGLNSGNGLPATNVGGSPSGTSTGLRTGATGWGVTTDVVAGLSYAQGNKTFVTTGGAARVNNADWGGNPFLYRNMATDPFLALRIGGVANGNLGVDGTSLYVSLLGSTSSATADAFRFSFKYDGSANFFLSNTATGWSLNGTVAANAPLALNTPTLFVLRFDFAAGATDSIRLWVNPPLGQALGTPNATVSGLNFPGLQNFQTRAAVANAMSFDELRIGTSLAAVTPYTEPVAAPVITSILSQSGFTGLPLSYAITASNAPTSYAATGLPAGLSIDGATGVISGTPAAAGTTNTTISATNAAGTATATLVVTITVPVPATYYVSPSGDDMNNGTSAGSAWRSLAKVGAHVFVPGDVISFEGGQTFNGTLVVTSSGTAANPVTYTSHGTGRATINSGNAAGLLSNRSHIAVTKLNFVGAGYTINTANGLNFTVADDARVKNIRLDQLNVSGYGSFGIRFHYRASGTAEYGYEDVLVSNVRVHDNKDSGFTANPARVNTATYTHANFIIRDSWFYKNRGFATANSSGNGLVLADMDGALIERCVAYENGLECTATGGGPVGIWSWESNNVIIQFCEAYKNGNAGSWDGGGFDIDGGNTNCVIQYCYSHENQGAGYLVAQFQGANRPARNNVIRYNISVNDATLGIARNQGAITVWNAPGNSPTDIQDTFIYGNTIYQSVGPDALRTTDTATTNTRIFNNIFIATSGKAVARVFQTGGVLMQGNLYWGDGGAFGVTWGGAGVASLAAFQALGQEKDGATLLGRHADPLLTAPGLVPTFNDPAAHDAWTAYRPTAASPAIDAGVSVAALIGATTSTAAGPAIAHPGARDFQGNAIPQGATHDIGAHESTPAAPPVPVVTAGQTPAAAQGVAFSYTLLAEGSPSSWTLSGGSLPPGVTLNIATGVLTGTPGLVGTFTPSFTATNGAGASAPVAVTLTVRDPLRARWRFDNSLAAEPPAYNGAAVGAPAYAAGRVGAQALSLTGATGTYVTAPFVLNPAAGDFTASAWVYPLGLDQCILQQEDGSGAGRGWLYLASGNRLYSKLGNLETAGSTVLPAARWTHVALVKSGGTITLYVNGVAEGSASRTVESSVGALRIGVNKAGAANWSGRIDDLRIYDAALAAASVADLAGQAAPAALENFRAANGLAADGSQDLLAPAGDGVANLLKYAFNMIGSGPGQAASLATPNASVLAPSGSAGLPFAFLASAPPRPLCVTYVRRRADAYPQITYAVQFSDTLGSWAENPSATETAVPLDAVFERVTVTDSVANASRRFVRVRVAVAP